MLRYHAQNVGKTNFSEHILSRKLTALGATIHDKATTIEEKNVAYTILCSNLQCIHCFLIIQSDLAVCQADTKKSKFNQEMAYVIQQTGIDYQWNQSASAGGSSSSSGNASRDSWMDQMNEEKRLRAEARAQTAAVATPKNSAAGLSLKKKTSKTNVQTDQADSVATDGAQQAWCHAYIL